MYKYILQTAGKKNSILFLLVCVSIIGISATQLTYEKPVNLKVLPKDITDKKLNDFMVEDCGDALGVTCNYCHVEDKPNNKFDYASDAIPQKDTARSMMRMTMELNRKFFGKTNPDLTEKTMLITCYTCHHGDPVPKEKK